MHWFVLDEERQNLLKSLNFLKQMNFYLAGGTALALQIGHRSSVDFDFYNRNTFISPQIIDNLGQNKLTIIQQSEGSLAIRINNIEASFFRYPYKLLNPLIEEENLYIASIEDIAAMKIIALIQRGLYRDFIDLYFLVKMLGLENIINFTKRKYPPFNPYLAIQALTYFDDADADSKSFKATYYKETSWPEIKNFFIEQVKIYKEKEIK